MSRMNPIEIIQAGSMKDRIERYIIIGIILGAALLGTGIASSVASTTGTPAVLTLVGSFITFIFTVILVLYWFVAGTLKSD